MNIISLILRHSTKSDWADASLWFGWAVLGGLLPLWATPLVFSLMESTWSLNVLLDNGEFVLYAASYLGGSLYIVVRDYKSTSFPNRGVLVLLMVVLLLISAFTFALVSSNAVPRPNRELNLLDFFNQSTLTKVSLVVLPLAILISYLVMVVENIRQLAHVNLEEFKQQDLSELVKDFDKLEG